MASSTALEYTRLITRLLALIGRILALPLRAIWLPLSYLARALGIALFPLVSLVAHVAGWCRWVFDFISALQPLYTFLATAALVGGLAGLALAASSTIITAYLGMQGDTKSNGSIRGSRSRTTPQGKDPLSEYSSPNSLIKDDSSSNEGEWYWPDPSPSRRRPATGLLSQTILEEEDDSDV